MAGCGFYVIEKTHPSIVFTGKEKSISAACPHPNPVTAHKDKNEIQTPLLP